MKQSPRNTASKDLWEDKNVPILQVTQANSVVSMSWKFQEIDFKFEAKIWPKSGHRALYGTISLALEFPKTHSVSLETIWFVSARTRHLH